jgi:hypothetical protein
MIPIAIPSNADGHALNCRYEKSACCPRCIASDVLVIGMYLGVPVVPLVCA